MAVELLHFGLLDKIYPLMLGTIDKNSGLGFRRFSFPKIQGDVVVDSIDNAVKVHLETQGLGLPLLDDHTVRGIWNEITKVHGFVFPGRDDDLKVASENICNILMSVPIGKTAMDNESQNDLAQLESAEVKELKRMLLESQLHISSMKSQNETLNAINARTYNDLAEKECEIEQLHQQLTRFHKIVCSLKYRAECSGLKVPIRAGPSQSEAIIGYVKHEESVTVHRTIVNGYMELKDSPVS